MYLRILCEVGRMCPQYYKVTVWLGCRAHSDSRFLDMFLWKSFPRWPQSQLSYLLCSIDNYMCRWLEVSKNDGNSKYEYVRKFFMR